MVFWRTKQEEKQEEKSEEVIGENIDSEEEYEVIQCPKKKCDKAMRKAKTKEVYSLFLRWRNCNQCFKMIVGNTEIWTCQNHYMGYDVCTKCMEQHINAQSGDETAQLRKKRSKYCNSIKLKNDMK